MLKAVLFDRDDTLTTFNVAKHTEVAQQLSIRFGINSNQALPIMLSMAEKHAESWRPIRNLKQENDYWQSYITELFEKLGLDISKASDFLQEYPYWQYLQALPDARAVLLSLRAKGLKIGVLSNTFPSIQSTLQWVGLADLVDVALATCSLGYHKPEPTAFALALDALGLAAHEVLFVDDRPENVAAAQALGMQVLQIDHSGKTTGALSSLSELLECELFV